MQDLHITQGVSHPAVDFGAAGRTLSIRGESFPENASRFYTPVVDWISQYLESAGPGRTVVEMEIIYFNSSTSKIFMMIFDLLDKAVVRGADIVVNWHANRDNQTAIQCGEEFQEDLEHLPFNLVLD